jgi:hypothetical protein
MEKNSQYIGNWRNLLDIKDDNVILHYSFDFWNTIAVSNPIFKQKRADYICGLVNQEFTASLLLSRVLKGKLVHLF